MTKATSTREVYSTIVGEDLPEVFYREGHEGVLCSNCRSRVHTCGDVVASVLLTGHGCSFCGVNGEKSLDNEMVMVRGNSRHRVLAHDKLREMTWFHATVRDDWGENYNVEFTDVHAGSRLTALSRITQLLSNGAWSFMMYELRIKSKASMTRRIDDFECVWPETTPNRVSPYTNLYELSGSTSLYAHTSALEVIGSESLDMRNLKKETREARNKELCGLKG